ncbi:MAG: response regulator [bacterium]|nr:response regulator [bacterium]
MAKKKKILLLEDEKVLGEILLNKLLTSGYDTSWETDGESGIQKMRTMKPDLLLLDIVMPKKDGYEVLEEMRKDEELKNIPTIVISNSGQPVEISRILELGAKDYIIKAQFNPDEVLEKIQKFLGKEAGSAEDGTPVEHGKQGGKIWIVEDDQFLSSLSSSQLAKEGYTVKIATDGAQALKLLDAETPDLVLLDIMMPGMTGFEVLKAMRADARCKNTIIVMFSNLGQEHEIEEARKNGADDFLVKAKFTLREVVERVNALIDKKKRKA